MKSRWSMKPRWDPSGTIGDAFHLAGRLTVRGYAAEGGYIFREVAVPLAGTPALEPALDWWSLLSSAVVEEPDRELGARLHSLAVSLVETGHRGEAVRVLTMALRHLPGRDSSLVISSRRVTRATGTAAGEIAIRLSEEAVASLRRGRTEGVTLLAGALRVGGAEAWAGKAARAAVSALPELHRWEITPPLLGSLARNAYELRWLGLEEPAVRLGMLIPTMPRLERIDLFRDPFVTFGGQSARVVSEARELSEELRRKGYLPEAAELAATVLDLGRTLPDVRRMLWNELEEYVLPQTGVRFTGWDKTRVAFTALGHAVWPGRAIVASRLPQIDALAEPAGEGDAPDTREATESFAAREGGSAAAGGGGGGDDDVSPTAAEPDRPEHGAPDRPDGERAINALLTDDGREIRPPLVTGHPYALSFSVGAPVLASLVTGKAARVPASDVPSDGLETRWIVRSTTVELRDLPADASVEVEARPDGGWVARFSLHVPHVGETAVRRLLVVPRVDAATLEVVIFTKVDARPEFGEHDRFEEYRRLTLDLGTVPQGAPLVVASDVCLSPMGHLGLRPAHEWMTPRGELSVSVSGDHAILKGTLATRATDGSTCVEDAEDSVDWYGADPRAAGAIDQLRAAAEAFRTQCEAYLNDIDPDGLAARLSAFTPQYDWDPIAYDADAEHEQAWAATANSQELFDVAFYGHQLYNIFFPRDTKPRIWLDALVPGHRVDVSWFGRSGPAWRTHVPWGLMYQVAPARAAPVDPMLFLGLRFRVGYVARPHRGSKGLGAPDRAYQTSFLYWGSGADDQIAAEALWQRQVFQSLRQQVFFPADVASASKSEIVRALNAPGLSPLAVLYLFCTCAVGKGNEPVLRFGATNNATDVLRQAELGASELVDRPLVFANACTTVAADPHFTNELALTFFDRGCRAFLGTEARVPIRLASRFAYLFFQFFARQVAPEPVAAGEAVSQARLFLWRHYRNIGGLFYTYVNQYELFLAADDEVVSLKEHH